MKISWQSGKRLISEQKRGLMNLRRGILLSKISKRKRLLLLLNLMSGLNHLVRDLLNLVNHQQILVNLLLIRVNHQ